MGEILRNGETWYGFDLSRMTLDDAYNDKVNLEVILIRKKREGNKRMWKLKRMDIEKLEKKKEALLKKIDYRDKKIQE